MPSTPSAGAGQLVVSGTQIGASASSGVVGALLLWHNRLAVCGRQTKINERRSKAHRPTPPGRSAMEIILIGLGSMFAIWVLVIWGSSIFNKNMQ
jgi:hypothetical protein